MTSAGEKVAVGIESLSILRGQADPRDIAEAIAWTADNRQQLRAWWSKYAEGRKSPDKS